MNTETGQIVELKEFHNLTETEQEPFIPVLNKDMTKKQQRTKQVSLHDNKSKLGKQLHEHRRMCRKSQRK